ncbi:MAG TPA: hypothetical protein VJH97_06155 [Candidatus Nanoarchaeia archaeon]|nr:hypothetical protein [Candidatus Nanoarchaeia archaeon]
MPGLAESLGVVAPYYNLVLVVIIIPLFIKLLKIRTKRVNLQPWKLLFIGFGIFIVEELLTILNGLGITNSPRILTSLFEMVIVTLFIYMLLLQREIAHSK